MKNYKRVKCAWEFDFNIVIYANKVMNGQKPDITLLMTNQFVCIYYAEI